MLIRAFFFVKLFFLSFIFAQSLPVPTTLDDFFLPGSQPLESGNFDNPTSCICHNLENGYINEAWQASMMTHALLDPFFQAAMTIANQDAAEAGDLCLRCHTPTGWIEGRSVPTDGSSLISDDESSVNCLFCHRMIKPSEIGVNPFSEDSIYSTRTYSADSTYLSMISAHIPQTSANGMYVLDDNSDYRRGPYHDASPLGHEARYSPFHQQSDLCGTCHDVSNPVYSKDSDGSYYLNTLGDTVPSFDPYEMFPVERTFSEWLNSAYNTEEGISGTTFGGNKENVSTCQDCHMRDVTGEGGFFGDSRTDLGLHDLTGGNTFVPGILTNMSATVKDSSIARATRMLQLAASMEVTIVDTIISVKVFNETGHKLPSGYPEGRRIWLNLKVYDTTNELMYESGAYDNSTGILTLDEDIKVYEIKPGLSQTIASAVGLTAGPSFHFVLNDTIYSDNRIPPRGFSNSNFEAIQSPPIGYTYDDGEYWDETIYNVPQGFDSISVTLYYQTTSKEYIEFLRDNNVTNTKGQELFDLWNSNGKSTPVAMLQQRLNSDGILLSITLKGFSAAMQDGFPLLTWQTQSETENLGFTIYRKAEHENRYKEIASYKNNKELKNAGSSSKGNTYTYVDSDNNLIPGRAYYYKIGDVNSSGEINLYGPEIVTFNPESNLTKKSFELLRNYPNPFNNQTTIKFFIKEKQPIRVNVYDINGRLVRDFPKFFYYAGENEVIWDGKNNFGKFVPSGTYIYSIVARKEKKYGKMILLK